MNEAQRLRKYTFRSPSLYYTIPLMFVPPLLFYISSRNIPFLEIYSLSVLSLIITDYLSPKIWKFQFGPNRSFLLDSVVLYASLIYYFIIVTIHFLNPVHALMLSITFIPFIRTMVFLTFTERKNLLTHFLGISFSIYFSVYILIFSRNYSLFILPVILSSLVYSLSSHLFVKVSFSKFIKEFSTDPIKIITQMVNSVHSDLSYNQVIMNFFDQVYTTFAPREVTVLKASSGVQEFMMVFPYVHPGPLGELGSSNITGKLQRLHPGKSIMVFHTSTTHDDNCSSDDEIRKISKVLDEKGKDFTNSYEPFFGKYLTLIPLNEGGIFFISPDEPRFDDIKITEGMKIVKKAKSLGMKWAVIVDQHNNNMDKPEENKDVSYLMEEVELAVKGRKRQYPVYGSLAESYLTAKDIGPGGIKLLALEINKKKLAVILIDGNNMDYDLRLKIEEAITGYDKVLVCTTDNHIVNIDGLKVNPVGRSSEHEIIVNEIKRIAGQIVDMKELSFERIKKELRLKIAGEHHYDKLNETIRKSLNIAKISGILAILFSLGLSLFIFKILT